MAFDYPGSTRVVSLEDILPEYAYIDGPYVIVELSGDINIDMDRYHQNKAVRAVVEVIRENTDKLQDLSLNEFFAYGYGHGSTEMAVPEIEAREWYRNHE